MRSRFYNKHFRKPLRLYWWRYEYPNKTNFGDEITPYIIEKLFGLKTVWSEPENCELAGTGSIIEILQESSGKNDIQVWGSGFIKPGDNNTLLNLHFTALRGKLSRDRTDNKLAALGDPGLLAPLVFKPRRATKHKLGIIPHYVDQNNAVLEKVKNKKDIKIIDILAPVEQVIEEIVSCELILSSSLHGLIVSDAYKVPNYWMPFSNLLTGGDYKFRDYYSVFDEKPQPLKPERLNTIDVYELVEGYKAKQDIENLQHNLISAFPF